MKNKIYLILIALLGVTGFYSCKDVTTADQTGITYYAAFDLKGDETMLVTVDSSFVDPGVTATLQGVDCTNRIVKTGSVDINTMGIYYIKYSVTNDDGFTSYIKRKVIVCNPEVTTDISGKYSVDADSSYRYQYSNSAIIKYSGMPAIYGKGDFSKYTMTITKLAPGFFSVQDFFGGYYAEGRGLSTSYEMQGYIALDANNNISLISSSVSAWGDSLDDLTNTYCDPVNGIIKWSADYADSYSFNVYLKK